MVRAFETIIDDETYERLALGDDRLWELWDGVLVEKPEMSLAHNDALTELVRQLLPQLPRAEYVVRFNSARLRRPLTFFVPDLFVVPADPERARDLAKAPLEAYAEPALLVVEVWSPSTGRYDINAKLPRYMARGDAEIWRLHPYERTLTAWRRQPDGSYAEVVFLGGTIEAASLPGVTIDLDDLFAG